MQPELLRNIVPVILCGGGGQRLRPLSTSARPKAFLRLGSKFSMLQNTLLRVRDCADPVLLVNQSNRMILDHDLAEIGMNPRRIILEPGRRNTAPAIAAAAMMLRRDAVMMILPCDHKIGNPYLLLKAALRAVPMAADGAIVSLGVTPRYAETGYGYIRRGEAVNDNIYRVDRFVEKPVRSIAKMMIRSGTCDWNSGIVIAQAGTLLDEIQTLEPGLYNGVKKSIVAGEQKGKHFYLSPEFLSVPSMSIDVAVLERSRNVLVQHTELDWQDLGSWRRLAQSVISG